MQRIDRKKDVVHVWHLADSLIQISLQSLYLHAHLLAILPLKPFSCELSV